LTKFKLYVIIFSSKLIVSYIILGDWDAPYPLIDVAGLLKARGLDPTSVDSYNKRFSLENEEIKILSPHHPLFDSIATALCYQHLME
jgi:hypothetical protein